MASGDKVERVSGHHIHFSDFEVMKFNKRGEDSSSSGKVNSKLFAAPMSPGQKTSSPFGNHIS